MMCIVCKQVLFSTVQSECWQYKKCSKCFHNDQTEYPDFVNTRQFNISIHPTATYLNKGMDHAVREIEKYDEDQKGVSS